MALEDYLGEFSTTRIDIWGIIIGVLLAAMLGIILAEIYKRFGQSISNREKFSMMFVPIAMTTALIISIVKSSLALSLGLVGALSIIRFRTAIKEPEELGYLFLCIAIGIGMGALLYITTIIAFLIILGFLIFLSFGKPKNELGMNFIVKSSGKITLNNLSYILKKHRCKHTLRRCDTTEYGSEICYFIDSVNPHLLELITAEIKHIDTKATISYFEAQIGI
jgi:hypothetical protein